MAEEQDPEVQEMLDRIKVKGGFNNDLAKTLAERDRLTASITTHYQVHGESAKSYQANYHHFVEGQDQQPDYWKMKFDETAWAPVISNRVDNPGAILIVNAFPRVLHRSPTAEEREHEENRIILWSLDDSIATDLDTCPIIRPGGFIYTELQPGTKIHLRSKVGAGPLSAFVTLFPG